MIVMGVDPSTKSGVVRIDGDETYATVINNTNAKGIRRVQWIADQFEDYLDRLNPMPDVAVIEGYAYANKFTLATLVEIGIILRLSLHNRKIPCYICPPSVLKKFCTGKGNSKKPELAIAVKQRWGYENPSDDIIDAFILAKIAQELASGKSVVGLELLL